MPDDLDWKYFDELIYPQRRKRRTIKVQTNQPQVKSIFEDGDKAAKIFLALFIVAWVIAGVVLLYFYPIIGLFLLVSFWMAVQEYDKWSWMLEPKKKPKD